MTKKKKKDVKVKKLSPCNEGNPSSNKNNRIAGLTYSS
jgi:hypothetical protein